MKRSRSAVAVASLVALLAACAPMQGGGVPAAGSDGAPGDTAITTSFTVPSRALGEDRLVNVHLPRSYRARAGTRYPVLYMPDGGLDEDFPHVVATVDSLVALGRMREVIVVGIPNTQRRRDLTGPTRVARDSAIAPEVGGSERFRAFLRDELLPSVVARYRTTSERALMGESLAGLFVLETMLYEPSLFRHYVAFDASLWWNDGALVDTARALLTQRTITPATPPTLVMASSGDSGIAAEMARLDAILKDAARAHLTSTYEHRADLTHATIFRALKPGALVSIFRP